MKYFSTFSGIGGFELGIKQAYESNNEHAHISERSIQKKRSQGRKRSVDKHRILLHDRNRTAPLCVGYSEIDKYVIQVYNKQFNHKNYGDITKIDTNKLPNFDLLVGGFPCQTFSIAGKRKGFDDTRGTLFFDLARILADKRPRNFVFENVKGLLSHEQGKTFQTILGVLSDLGYRVEWQVLNSKNFGVPQNRERVFIVGHLGGGSGQQIFPIGGSSAKTVINPLKNKTEYGWHLEQNIYDKKGITRTVKAGGGSGNMPKVIQQLNNPTHSNDRVYSDKGISPTLNTMQGGRRQPFIKAVLTPDRINKRQNGRRMKENGEPSFTVTAQDQHGIYNGSRIRRLTPIECERLQGFPDNWTAEGIDEKGNEVEISNCQRYKMAGNAVTTNVVEAIISKLINKLS